MTRSMIQFHALPEELLPIALWMAGEFHTRIVGTEFPPLDHVDLTIDDLPKAFADPKISSFTFIFDSGASADCSAKVVPALDNIIDLAIERPTNNQLRQSSIGIIYSNPAVGAAWKAVASRIRKMTRAGVICTNPNTGAATVNRSFRFTQGAKSLASQGVTMLPVAGGVVMTFD